MQRTHAMHYPLLLAFLFLSFFSPATADARQNEDVSITRLINGMDVVVLEDSRFPLASVRLCVRAGASWENPEEAGVSHFLEHLLFKGSKTAPKGPASKLEQAGAQINAFTGMDRTCYVTDMPAESWKIGVEGMRDYAFDPLLRPEDVDAEREVVIAEMKMYEDNPNSRVTEQLQPVIFAGTPYEHLIIGSEKTLRALTPESIRAYMDRRYTPQEMVLVVVGDVQKNDVIAYAREIFGSYENTVSTQVPQPVQTSFRGFKVIAEEKPYGKVSLALAFPGPGNREGNINESVVLSYLLGGDNTSLLTKKFRFETPLVDAISAGTFSADLTGAFMISAYLDAEQLPAFWEALLKELSTLSVDAFTDADIERAKANLENAHERSQETYSHLATMLGYNVLVNRNDPLDTQGVYALQRVNRASLQQYLNTWIQPDNMALSLVIPTGKTPEAGFFEKTAETVWPAAEKKEQPQANTQGELEIIHLGNERTVVLMPDNTLPYFSVALTFTGAERLLGPDSPKQGLAEFTNSLMAEATTSRNPQELSLYLAENLASFSGTSSFNYFGFLLDGPTKNSAAMLSLFEDVLQNPAFAEKDRERLRRETLAGLISMKETPEGLYFSENMPWLFPGSVYGNHVAGTEESVKSFTDSDIRAFWKEQATMPWFLVVAGDFDKKAILDFAHTLPVPTGTLESLPAPAWRAEKSHNFPMEERNQGIYSMVFPAVNLLDEEYPAFAALDAYLSGLSGPVFELGRDAESLGYVVQASGMYGSSIGLMFFFALTDPATFARSEAVFKQILEDLRTKPIPQEELNRAKTSLSYSFYASNQKLARRALNAAVELVHMRPLNGQQERLEKVQQVTAQEIMDIAQKYLDPAKAYTLTVGPGKPE